MSPLRAVIAKKLAFREARLAKVESRGEKFRGGSQSERGPARGVSGKVFANLRDSKWGDGVRRRKTGLMRAYTVFEKESSGLGGLKNSEIR